MTDQDWVGVVEKVAVEVGLGLAEEVALGVEEGEGVVEGEALALAVGVPEGVGRGEAEAEGHWEALKDAPEVGDSVGWRGVGEGSPVAPGVAVPNHTEMVGWAVKLVSTPTPVGAAEVLA